MRKYLVFASILVLLVIAVFSFAQNRRGNEEIACKVVGTWRLISIEATRPNGEVIHDWGQNPTGLIMYDSSGRMAVQFMRDPPPTSASNPLTIEEKNAAFEGYYAYFGTYEFNEKDGTVTHHIQSSMRPYEVGTDYKRFYKLGGNRLTLSTPPMLREGEQRVYRLVWERAQ